MKLSFPEFFSISRDKGAYWLISWSSSMGFFIGIRSFWMQFKIGNWNPCLLLWMLYMVSLWGVLVRISYAGYLPRVGVLRWVAIIRHWWVFVISPSLGGAFGSRRFLPKQRSLFEWLLWENFWQLITFCKQKLWILDWCYTYKCSGKSVNHLLSYCSPALVYGVHVVWSLLGNAEVCGWPSSMLAREVWSASQQYCLDGCPSLCSWL